MAAGNQELGEFSNAGEQYQREEDQKQSAVIAEAKSEAGEHEDGKMLEFMRDAGLRS